MTTIIKNQIVKQLARFTKNLSPGKISLKFLKGEGELRNLELNEKFLTDLLELPPFIRLTRAVCNKISAKFHWTRLKTDPIRLFLDCVEVDMEMIENVSDDFYLKQPAVATNQGSREKPSEYGFAEKVVDGMHVTINSVVMAFKTPTFRATFQMSHLSVHSTDPSWEKASLRSTRIKDELGKEVLTFKQITLGTLRIDADALYKSGQEDNLTSSPLRLITSGAQLNIVIKKKIEDCSVVAARLHAICDDILWVLTHAQLQAVASFAKSVVQVVEKCKKSEPAPSVASDDSSQSYTAPNENWNEHIPTTEYSNQTASSLFQREDVKETSYRVTTGKIDIHLCDDTPIEKSFMDEGGQLGGSMQIVVNRLSFEHYPYHLAFTSRINWASHNDASLTRAHWVQELFNSYKKLMKEDSKKYRRKPQQAPEQGNGKYSRSSQDSGMNRNAVMATDGVAKKPSRVFLYECAFVISCDEFIVMPVLTNDVTSTSSIPFLCSDKKSLHLPSDMPTLQFDYTLYFYPGQEDARVPQPNLFCQINPLHLTMDNVTCIWFHRFMQSIRSGFAWAEDIITAQETEPRHIDVRIDGLMPKLTLPCPSEPNSYYRQYRPQALQVQISSFRVSNTRIGLQFKQCDLVNTLEVFLKSQLYTNKEVFPNDSSDVKPLPQMAWLNDFSLCSGVANIENGGDITDGHHSVVWMLNARQCWCEFVGIEETNGRSRPFIEPFPLNLCMCYPIARVDRRPTRLPLHDSNMSSEHVQSSTVIPLHRSPSDPYCRQAKQHRKSSSTKSTPLSSPGFAKIHKSRSAASVNIPVLSSDLHDNIVPGLSPNVSESGSEESVSSYMEDSVISGSIQSISSNSIRNGKVSTSSTGSSKPVSNNGISIADSRESSFYRTTPFVSSTSGVESDGSGDSFLDKDSSRANSADNKQDDHECALSILLNIPDTLAIKLDHYQFVFLMRLQESFVKLRDVLFADLEKFNVQRRKLQGKHSEEIPADDPGILVSLISKGAEVVLLVPAPNVDLSEAQDQNSIASHDRNTSPNVVEQLELIDAEDDLKAVKDYQFSPRDNEKLLEADDHDEHFIADDTVVEPNVVAHPRSGSESSSANTSTFGSDYSLLQAGTGSERSYEARDISTVTIVGTSLECSVAMKNDDFAFKLLACGCDVTEGYHENLEVYLNPKGKHLKEPRTTSSGCGELRLRYAMGSTVDQSMLGAVENGVVNLMLSDISVPLLMSNVDGILECVQDEVEVPPPLMPAIIDIKNLRLNITSDTPLRLLSLPQSLPLNVHIDHGTITRTGSGEIQINVPMGSVPSSAGKTFHRTADGLLVTSDEMIERLREESNEMTARVASIRHENVRLLNELQVSNETKECLENERDKLLVTVERLTEELVKSNREYDKMQELIRHFQRSDQS